MDLTAIGLNYLNVKDVKDGEAVRFLSDGELIENSFGKKKYSFYVEHNGSQKVLQISAPQVRQLVNLLGGDSKAWIGKSVILELKQIQLFDNKAMTLAISFQSVAN